MVLPEVVGAAGGTTGGGVGLLVVLQGVVRTAGGLPVVLLGVVKPLVVLLGVVVGCWWYY